MPSEAVTVKSQDTKKVAAKLADDLKDLKISPETKEAMARYLPYLAEAQRKLLFTLVIFIVITVISALYYKPILVWIMGRFNLQGINMVFTSPLQFFEVAVQIGISLGLIVTVPLLVYNLLTFLRPALEKEEYEVITSLLPYAAILFVAGFALGAWVMQFVVSLFSQATAGTSIMNIWDMSRFFSQILFMGFLMGFVFQFPIILTILMRFKIIKKSQLVKYRLQVYAASVIFAVLMPAQDILSDIILSLPLFFLFELTLLLNKD